MSNLTPEQHRLAQQEAFDQGTQVAQIFSGIFFSGLACWLTVTNGTKLAFVQRAALEKRLTTCCFLSVYVGFFSAFFNFFQLTAVDDMLLHASQDQFTLDLARPIEWILTCPIMQLSLVLMGGAKLPEYRRYLMPAFSVAILACGTTSTLITNMSGKLVCYAAGVILFTCMVYFNRLQIIEYSSGDECLVQGDSEFRKATLLLIATWAPFPIWFVLSPEGFGIISNVLLIQVGWAFLNIVAKFSFIFYIQRVKDLYCNRLKTKRELGASSTGKHRHGASSPPDFDFSGGPMPGCEYESAQAYEAAEQERKKEKLAAVVVETMSFLGMAQHTDRFLKLLERAQVYTVPEVEMLNKTSCQELQLPYDLVTALQKRLRVWKLEMVDDAEMGLEKGEEHYIKKTLEMPKMDPLGDIPNNLPHMMPSHSMGMAPQQMMQPMVPQTPGLMEMETPSRFASEVPFEELWQKTEEKILEGQEARMQSWDRALEALRGTFQSELGAMEKRLLHQVSHQLEATSKTAEQRGELRAFESRLTSKLEELSSRTPEQSRELSTLEKRLNNSVEQHMAMLETKLEACCQKVEACGQRVDSCGHKVDSCGQKVEACHSTQMGQHAQSVGKLAEQVEAVSAQVRAGTELLLQRAEALQGAQAKLAADADAGWRGKLEELERSLTCRDEEAESTQKRRHEELCRLAAGKRLDDLTMQLLKVGERAEAAVDSASSSLHTELTSVAGRLTAKVESLHSATQRLLAESDTNLQQRVEDAIAQAAQSTQQGAAQSAMRAEKAVEALEGSFQRQIESLHGAQQGVLATAQRAEKAAEQLEGTLQRRFEKVEQVVAQAAQGTEQLESGLQKRLEKVEQAAVQAIAQGSQQGALQASQRAEKAVQALHDGLQKLDQGMQRRLEEAILKASAEGVGQGAAHAAARTEKALESLDSAHRADLHSAVTSLAERIDDTATAQMRKVGEREERTARRFEELLEVSQSRTAQKVDDVGLDLKKELHGFAKRLNSKIPFM